MFEFNIIENFKPNKEIVKLLENYKYKIKLGNIKHITKTNIQVVNPTEYLITSPIKLTIFEYKITEINNKNFYIKEYRKKYNLKDLKEILKE